MEKFVDSLIDNTIRNLDQTLHLGKSYDVLKKVIYIGQQKGAIYYINGMCKEDLMEKIEEFFANVPSDTFINDSKEFSEKFIPYIEVELKDKKEDIITDILSGVACLVVDGMENAFLIDARDYPSRAVTEPEKYRVLRGSRDGFVETIVRNTSLIRRRIRSTDLRCEVIRVGESSKTDVALCYMEKRVDKELLENIKERIRKIDTDALALSQESLSECLFQGSFLNPFPKFRYTERPDTTAASIMEGQIAIIVDNSPSAMLLPTTIFDVIEEADDYYFPPVTGTYLRLSRTFITLVSLLITPMYLLFSLNADLAGEWFQLFCPLQT